MIFCKKQLLLLVFALLVMPSLGFAQYRFELKPFFSYFKDLKRYELSFNYVMPFAKFSGTSQVTDGSYVGDTTITRSIAGSSGMGGSIGLSLPFKATGHISCWAASIHLMFNTLSFPDLNSYYAPDGTLKPPTSSLIASTTHISLPVGIDWKVGNDAICSKRLIFGTSMGAGLMPQLNMTNIAGGPGEIKDVKTGMGFGCTPYLKVEGAVFMGWCVKVRAMYTMGDITMIEVNHAIPGTTDGPFKVVSNGNLLVSLVLMPFSGGWKETAWWNTHDTYNQHDRFN
jgi:hypothetical protein